MPPFAPSWRRARYEQLDSKHSMGSHSISEELLQWIDDYRCVSAPCRQPQRAWPADTARLAGRHSAPGRQTQRAWSADTARLAGRHSAPGRQTQHTWPADTAHLAKMLVPYTCHQGRDEKFENLDDKRTTHHGSIKSLISQPATGVFRGQGPTPLFAQATPIFTANTEQQPGIAHSPLPKAQCNCPAIVHSSTAQRGEEDGGPESGEHSTSQIS
ncbi:hypothetical protein NQZ68_012533 [Dissostichus eleginoides]|nr:hypothetical protein NQZ68_012533 [Dissostichus eleginoides]